MRRPDWVHLLTLLLLLIQIPASSGQPRSCRFGCLLDGGTKVCGVDGITYPNSCVAVCQGVSVDTFQPCENPRGTDVEQDPDFRVVSLDILFRFRSERFRFVGKIKVEPISIYEVYDGIIEDEEAVLDFEEEEGESERSAEEILYAYRVTSEGYTYIAALDPISETSGDSTSSLDVDQQTRHLALIGNDTRSIVHNTQREPYKKMGKVLGCSGTVISRSAILTAAHCLYEPNSGTDKWSETSFFAPARYRDDGDVEDPYGRWLFDHVTMYDQWRESRARDYDIAVVQLKPAEDDKCLYVGDVVGHAGLRRAELGSDLLNRATVSGYPSDKDDGEMWTSGPCEGEIFERSGYRYIGFHYCDTYAGNSGSSLFDERGSVQGIHVASWYDRSRRPLFNGAVLLRGQHYNRIRDWAEFDDTICFSQSPTISPMPTSAVPTPTPTTMEPTMTMRPTTGSPTTSPEPTSGPPTEEPTSSSPTRSPRECPCENRRSTLTQILCYIVHERICF